MTVVTEERVEALGAFSFCRGGAVVSERLHISEGSEGDALMAGVNRYSLKALTADEVAVFRLDLCNDQIDREFSQFSVEELAKIAELAPGRPLMERHDRKSTLPRGTFFRAALHSEGGQAGTSGFENGAPMVTSVRCEVYVLRTEKNADFIAQIEGGVYRDISIGFEFMRPECSICASDLRECEHIPGREYDGETCHFIMRDVKAVSEGSVVVDGAQGTQFLSQSRSSRLRGLAATEVVGLPDALAIARHALGETLDFRNTVEAGTSANGDAGVGEGDGGRAARPTEGADSGLEVERMRLKQAARKRKVGEYDD